MGYIKWAGLAARSVDVRRRRCARSEKPGRWGWALLAACAFFFLCEDGKRGVLCEHIAEELQETVDRVGDQDCIFEIKSMKLGLIIRVYFIKAGERGAALRCGDRAQAITRSWYQSQVWITQFVDLADEDEAAGGCRGTAQ